MVCISVAVSILRSVDYISFNIMISFSMIPELQVRGMYNFQGSKRMQVLGKYLFCFSMATETCKFLVCISLAIESSHSWFHGHRRLQDHCQVWSVFCWQQVHSISMATESHKFIVIISMDVNHNNLHCHLCKC